MFLEFVRTLPPPRPGRRLPCPAPSTKGPSPSHPIGSHTLSLENKLISNFCDNFYNMQVSTVFQSMQLESLAKKAHNFLMHWRLGPRLVIVEMIRSFVSSLIGKQMSSSLSWTSSTICWVSPVSLEHGTVSFHIISFSPTSFCSSAELLGDRKKPGLLFRDSAKRGWSTQSWALRLKPDHIRA